jgi:hypothetical protein
MEQPRGRLCLHPGHGPVSAVSPRRLSHRRRRSLTRRDPVIGLLTSSGGPSLDVSTGRVKWWTAARRSGDWVPAGCPIGYMYE